MGLGGISPTQLIIILVIVILIFGTKKLKSMGSDLGGAVKGFKKSLNDDEQKNDTKQLEEEQVTPIPDAVKDTVKDDAKSSVEK